MEGMALCLLPQSSQLICSVLPGFQCGDDQEIQACPGDWTGQEPLMEEGPLPLASRAAGGLGQDGQQASGGEKELSLQECGSCF